MVIANSAKLEEVDATLRDVVAWQCCGARLSSGTGAEFIYSDLPPLHNNLIRNLQLRYYRYTVYLYIYPEMPLIARSRARQ